MDASLDGGVDGSQGGGVDGFVVGIFDGMVYDNGCNGSHLCFLSCFSKGKRTNYKYKLKCKINVKTYETAVIVMIVLARRRY